VWVKKARGMEFRDLRTFNLAMLAKQVWRSAVNPNSLTVRLLKTRYFLHGDNLTANVGYSGNRKNLLKKGLGWIIGDGSHAHV